MSSIRKEYNDKIIYYNEKGKWHREDGPALEWNTGSRYWYLNDESYTEKEWEQEVAKIKLKRILDL